MEMKFEKEQIRQIIEYLEDSIVTFKKYRPDLERAFLYINNLRSNKGNCLMCLIPM